MIYLRVYLFTFDAATSNLHVQYWRSHCLASHPRPYKLRGVGFATPFAAFFHHGALVKFPTSRLALEPQNAWFCLLGLYFDRHLCHFNS